MSPKRQIRRQPLRSTSAVGDTSSPISSRAWNMRARGSSSKIDGGDGSTLTMVSVTTSVFDFLWKKAVSPNAPTALNLSGPSTSNSISSAHSGIESASALLVGSSRSRRPEGKPRSGGEIGRGNDHWPGWSHTVACVNCLQNGPASALCSRPSVPSTTCFTGPCLSSSSRSMRTDSGVGATGLCTHSPPSFSLITVWRTGTLTLTTPWI
mmetsp:Transcript_33206/g.69868  ORF Transcript_33206/g.69868 Transcript_33206/m.69868 type:complete len:209 (+) Transcript_33206:1399-2025(+)